MLALTMKVNECVKVANGQRFINGLTTAPGQTLARSACRPRQPQRQRHAPSANDQRLRLGELLHKSSQARHIAHEFSIRAYRDAALHTA